jgi:hypothetical protein
MKSVSQLILNKSSDIITSIITTMYDNVMMIEFLENR